MLQAAKYIGSGLATIGLTKNILSPVLSSRVLTPSVISPLAKVAIDVVDQMLRSLPSDSLVLQHINQVASTVELQVTAQIINGIVVPDSSITFPNGQLPSSSSSPSGTGVYAFTEIAPTGQGLAKQTIGSALNFLTRLRTHFDGFLGSGKLTILHRYGMTVGGISAFTFGRVYVLPNYLSSFTNLHPGYTLTQGEYDILMAVSQLVPRILEQSLIYHLSPELNGKGFVLFRYTSFYLSSLSAVLNSGSTAVIVEVLRDGKVIQTVPSKQALLTVLGVGSRRTIEKYFNHVSPINSPVMGLVNLRVVGFDTSPLTHTIIHRTSNDFLLPDLIIPGLDSDTDLPIGPVLVYNEDKTLYSPEGFPSISAAAKALNPSSSKPRGREIKISRSMGLELLVVNELGNFYFIENPLNNRFELNHAGKYPCHLYDLETGTCVFFEGLRPIVNHLAWFSTEGTLRNPGCRTATYDRIKTCYDRSTTFSDARLLLGRFKIVPDTK